MKTCYICKKEKKDSCFHTKKGNVDGLNSYCIDCNRDKEAKYRHSKRGLIGKIYSHQKEKAIKQGTEMPTYTVIELYDFAINSKEFNNLYDRWVESGYRKQFVPTFDRDNDYETYSFDNFRRWATFEENKNRYYRDAKNGINNKKARSIVSVDCDSEEVRHYYSTRGASRDTGVSRSDIWKCMNNAYNRKTAGGCKWYYCDEFISIYGNVNSIM